jgi:hypothetical protein
MPLTNDEIRLIKLSRDRSLARRPEFMEMAQEVCELMGIPFAKVCGVTRGSPAVCECRALICKIAFDRGFHPAVIAQYIRRERTSVIHAVQKIARNPVDNTKETDHVLPEARSCA